MGYPLGFLRTENALEAFCLIKEVQCTITGGEERSGNTIFWFPDKAGTEVRRQEPIKDQP